MGMLLEICIESLAGSRAAVAGGADRLELCAELSVGGLTPAPDLLEAVLQESRVPVVVLVRPRPDNFVYGQDELASMGRSVRAMVDAGAQGVTVGVLQADGQINRAAMEVLIEQARPAEVCFHRAFDCVPDQTIALEGLIDMGVQRVLTSGGSADATEGTGALASLVERARGRIVVMPGGGVRPGNARALAEATGASALHSSCSSARPWVTDEALVRALRAAVDG